MSVTGSMVTSSDGLPQHICSFCVALLLRCNRFIEQCKRTLNLLEVAIRQDKKITNNFIQNIDRESHNLTHPYVTNPLLFNFECASINDKYESDADEMSIKREIKQELDVTEEKSEIVKPNIAASEDHCLTAFKTIKKERDKRRHVKRIAVFNKESVRPEVIHEIQKSYKADVVLLTKEQQIEEVNKRKLSKNYKQSSYRCDDCFRGFSKEVYFLKHVKDHHDPSAGPLVCELCSFRFRSVTLLRAHQRRHQLKIVCTCCRFVSRDTRLSVAYYSGKSHRLDASRRRWTPPLPADALAWPTPRVCLSVQPRGASALVVPRRQQVPLPLREGVQDAAVLRKPRPHGAPRRVHLLQLVRQAGRRRRRPPPPQDHRPQRVICAVPFL